MAICLPETFKIVEGLSNVTDGVGTPRTSDYVSLKNCTRATAIVTILGGAATAMDLNPYQATDVAATGEKVFTNVLRGWHCADTTATGSDTLHAETAAVDFNSAAAAKNQMFVIQIDPCDLDVANGFDCVCVKTEGDSNSNLISLIWLLETCYQQATPPAAITD
jgi:hypothetical protein